MKRLPMVISFVVALVAMVAGCGRAPRYDGRLTAADSLMRSDPDSALAVIEAVNPDSLTCEGDRAYRDLLLTQARYRCYITATTDSDINRALAYYQRHSGEREKLTRAYIYKGAVMEELGHPDSAMLYYKQAEATAAPDDYFNLGYIKLRTGYLYGQYYALNGKDIEKYEEAVDCFSHTNDTCYQIISMNNLGCAYRETMPVKAISMFKRAADLAHKLNDTTSIVSIDHSMIVLLFFQEKYDEAHQLIQEISNYNLEPDCLNSDYYFYAANVYAKLGMSDSAKVFFNLATQYKGNNPERYKMDYLNSLGEIALAENDTISYHKYCNASQHIADSLKANEEKTVLLQLETEYDKDTAQNVKFQKDKTIAFLIAAIIALMIMALIFISLRKRHFDRLIVDIKKENEAHLVNLSHLERKIDELQIQDTQLKQFIFSHTGMLRDVIEACYHEPRNRLSDQVKRIISYQKKNKQMWTRLYDYIDMEYNGIMKHTIREYPQLNEKEVLLIALSCLGYSYVEIAIIMGYSNATTISGNKQRVAKKMNLRGSLNEYIQPFLNHLDD